MMVVFFFPISFFHPTHTHTCKKILCFTTWLFLFFFRGGHQSNEKNNNTHTSPSIERVQPLLQKYPLPSPLLMFSFLVRFALLFQMFHSSITASTTSVLIWDERHVCIFSEKVSNE